MNVTEKVVKQRTERVKVELIVHKSLMGYRHGCPPDYYIAVVGSGLLLGDNNTNLAPRCKRIANNIWTKEIWLQKESLVTFKFLIVHAATNSAVEIENVPPRHVQIGQGPAVVEAQFNTIGLIRAYGVQEIRESEEVEVERKFITEKNQQMPSKKSGKDDEETAKCQEKNITERVISAKGSTGVPGHIQSYIDKIPEVLKEKYMEEIDQHTIIHEIDSGLAGVRRMVIGIASSSLKRFNISIEDMIQAFEKMDLPIFTPISPYIQEGYSHHEIWLPDRNAEIHYVDDINAEIRSVEDRKAEIQPVQERNAEIRHVEDRNSEIHRVEDRNAEVRPAKDRNAEIRPVEDRNAVIHLVEDRNAEVRPEEDRNVEIHRVIDRIAQIRPVEDRKSENYIPTAGLEELGNEMNVPLISHEGLKTKLVLSPASHKEQEKNDKTSIDEETETQEAFGSTTPTAMRQSTRVYCGCFSRKRKIMAALGGVALTSLLGIYAFYKH